MPDLSLAAGLASTASPVYVELVANNADLLASRKVVLAAGQSLLRGALLGRVTATGLYRLAASASTDGSQVPAAVLAHDTDATAANAETLVYERGDFNQAAVLFGAGITADTARDVLRDGGIYLIKPYGVA